MALLQCFIETNGAFFFVRAIVSFKGPTLVLFAFCVLFGQTNMQLGGVRRELDVGQIARNKMEGALYSVRKLPKHRPLEDTPRATYNNGQLCARSAHISTHFYTVLGVFSRSRLLLIFSVANISIFCVLSCGSDSVFYFPHQT